MKSIIKKTPDGREFKLPKEWKEYLGVDVLAEIVSVSTKLKQYGMSPSSAAHFIKSLQTIEEFNNWYDKEKQKKLANDKIKETVTNFTREKKESIAAKSKATCQERYGGPSSMSDSSILAKRQQTFKSKFGGLSPMSDPEIRA